MADAQPADYRAKNCKHQLIILYSLACLTQLLTNNYTKKSFANLSKNLFQQNQTTCKKFCQWTLNFSNEQYFFGDFREYFKKLDGLPLNWLDVRIPFHSSSESFYIFSLRVVVLTISAWLIEIWSGKFLLVCHIVVLYNLFH